MKNCPKCNLPLLGYVHSNGKEEGKMCLKCKRLFDIKQVQPLNTNVDYEELILARQEELYE